MSFIEEIMLSVIVYVVVVAGVLKKISSYYFQTYHRYKKQLPADRNQWR